MILWWIGNAIFLFVIIPVVVVLLRNLREPVIEIEGYVADALEHGVQAIAAMDAVDELEVTRDHVSRLGDQMTSYGNALDDML